MLEVKENIVQKLSFSGHETFHCRHLWLKKGYDFVAKGKKFSSEDAVIELGVGKNMVSAIFYWMKAFGLLDGRGALTQFANYIFSSAGRDPYLEDNATMWLLHYQLIKCNIASIYNMIFNDLRREKVEFTKENFLHFAARKAGETGFSQFNSKTAGADFEVFVKMYIRTVDQTKDKEDTFSGLLTDLNIVNEEKRKGEKGTNSFYSITNEYRADIPDEILLYTIIDQEGIQKSVNLGAIFQDRNQAGTIYAMNRNCIMDKVESLVKNERLKQYGITVSDHAGIKELQFRKLPEKFEVLDSYYG